MRRAAPPAATDLPPDPVSVRQLAVPSDRAGQRLDNFLLGQLRGLPRSLVYKLVRSGQVRVNGRRARVDSRLEGGETVRVPPLQMPAERDAAPPPLHAGSQLLGHVVHEDEQLLALDKPSGVASHGGSGIRHGAIELLRAARPGETLELVHRLDRDTSGLLLVAKKRSALTTLQRLMREGRVRKTYLALLLGRLPDGELAVDVALEKSTLRGGERMVRVGADGKASMSRFRILERMGGHSFTEVRIDTGRTHQIRVHACHIGHPVAGDDKYGDRDANKRLRERAGLRRMFLHAASLEFSLDERQRYLLSAPLPTGLRSVLDRLA